MAFATMSRRRSRPRRRLPPLNVEQFEWSAGYMSHVEAIRARKNALLDMTNMDMVQDGIPEVRPGLTPYGSQPVGQVIGMKTFNQPDNDGKVNNYQISMQVIGGVGKVLYNQDGGPWTTVTNSNYNKDRRARFTKLNNRVYVTNRHDRLSYLDINSNSIITYTEISVPSQPTITVNGMTGGTIVYRVRVSANNKVGETNASTAALVTVPDFRESWDPNTQSIKIEVPVVSGAESYNFYIGMVAGEESYLGNVPKPSSGSTVTFVDNNRAAINPFKKVPEGNSTSGPILENTIAADSRLYGIGDKDNPWRLWYSGQGEKSGDFSPYSGGGWVDIDKGGENIPTALKHFRNGRGDSAVTILCRGSASSGGVYHQSFESQTLGSYTITYPVIVKANGQSGTYSPDAVIEADNSMHYPSGDTFKTTGTKPQMVNILVTNNTADTIQKDCSRLNLSAMHLACGLEYNNRLFYALPVGSTTNSEIWIQDLSRRGIWILRWTIAADFMWLYEDSLGKVHHCVLVNNKILEFNKSVMTDDGQPFRTRLVMSTNTFSKSAMQMALVEYLRLLLLHPVGKINIKVYGVDEDNESIGKIGGETVSPIVSPIGWSTVLWSTKVFSPYPPAVKNSAKAQLPVTIEVSETVSEITCEITTDGNARYALNSSLLTGKLIPGMYRGEE